MLLVLLAVVSIEGIGYSQSFRCDGGLLISTHQGYAPTRIQRVYFGPFGVITYGAMATYPDGRYDGLGFNPQDNYIYAVREGTNDIYQLRADGTTELMTSFSELDTLHVGAGVCDIDGRYICYDYQEHDLLIFDIADDFRLVERMDLYWADDSPNSGIFSTRIDDIAIDPTDPTAAYIYQGTADDDAFGPDLTKGYLHRINLDTTDPAYGRVTPVERLSGDLIEQLGAMVFDAGGGLYGYGGNTESFTFAQNKLLSIGKQSGIAGALGTGGPRALVTDGCSCPYNLSFSNVVNPLDVLCTDSEVSFTFTINNRFNEDLSGVELTDTLPEGMRILEIDGVSSGTIDPQTGIDSRYLRITDMTIPAMGIIMIRLRVEVYDVDIEFIENHAHLWHLPERMGSHMVSDDPATPGFVGDATAFYSVPQTLGGIEVEVQHPSSCLDPVDGWIRIAAAELIAGAPYEVSLRNEEYEISTWQVVVEEDQSFLLDTVLPGSYELYQIMPQTTTCSFALRDTIIEVMGPEGQPSVTLETNAPLCASGTPLRLMSSSSPPSEVVWRGPLGYFALEESPTIASPVEGHTGHFRLTATYGACRHTDSIYVEIAPEIAAEISGPEELCERDHLELIGRGQGERVQYSWIHPDGSSTSDSTITDPSAKIRTTGIYKLIVDNGVCAPDTAYHELKVSPSPKIDMESLISSSFCESIQLRPQVSGATDGTYRWEHEGTLSCDDCPSPELLYPIVDQYTLYVKNEYDCQDSATVAVDFVEDRVIYIPNAFSPNQDGRNDRFSLSPGCGLEAIESLIMYDRTGAEVYQREQITGLDERDYWDGMIDGRAAASGVYFWQAQLLLVDGTTRSLRGNLHLVR